LRIFQCRTMSCKPSHASNSKRTVANVELNDEMRDEPPIRPPWDLELPLLSCLPSRSISSHSLTYKFTVPTQHMMVHRSAQSLIESFSLSHNSFRNLDSPALPSEPLFQFGPLLCPHLSLFFTRIFHPP
jgi:hypothetical protein